MDTISKKFYLTAIFGGLAGMCLLTIVGGIFGELAQIAEQSTLLDFTPYVIGAGITVLLIFSIFIYQLVVHFTLLHSMWQSIPPEHKRTTPGKAVGLSFIPVFHIYWRFKALWGWAKDYNTYIAKNNIDAPKMSEKMALILCICASSPLIYGLISRFFVSDTAILGILSYVLMIPLSVAAIFMIIFMLEGIDGANAIITAISQVKAKDTCTKKCTVKRISKALYLTSIIGGTFASIIIIGVGFYLAMPMVESFPMATAYGKYTTIIDALPFIFIVIIGTALIIYAVTLMYVLLYKIWQAIQFEGSRTTPTRAVGLLFVPFFAYYWVFQAFWGWAKDCNAYIAKHKLSIPKMSEGLSLAFSLTYLSVGILGLAFQFIGSFEIIKNIVLILILAGLLALFVLSIIFASEAINRVNAIAEAKESTTA